MLKPTPHLSNDLRMEQPGARGTIRQDKTQKDKTRITLLGGWCGVGVVGVGCGGVVLVALVRSRGWVTLFHDIFDPSFGQGYVTHKN